MSYKDDGGTRMEEIARNLRLLADATRLRLLAALLKGDATVSKLSACLDLPQPRISSHLAALREVGIVTALPDGRQHVYHVDGSRVAPLLAALRDFAPAPAVAAPIVVAPRARRVSAALREARSCYGHLAGVAGVQLLDAMLELGWIAPLPATAARQEYRLTDAGECALRERGVDVAAATRARRLFAFGCLDWTERRPHLGGALGGAVLEALIAAGIARRGDGRTVELRTALDGWIAGPIAPGD
jgi:DNA-binding transcriptional ArsR family regulator